MSRKILFVLFLSVSFVLAGEAAGQASADRDEFAAASARLTPEEVGDADSFGRNMKWLGLVAASVALSGDCSGFPTPDTCVTLNPAPAVTTFDLPDLSSITLPRRSSDSLLCHWQTPIVFYQMNNATGIDQLGQFRALPVYRFESEVLEDPSLVDPGTGLPLNGTIEIALSSIFEFGTLAPGETQSKQITFTRTCIAGMISRRSLELNYGLSASQARNFFRQPITIRMGIRGQASMVDSASIYFGTRFVGD